MRVFLDANVLFSAAASPDGRSSALLDLAERGRHVLLTSRHAITEARRNLERKRPDVLDRFDEVVLSAMETVPEAPPAVFERAAGAGLPDSDAPILAAAVAAGSDILVTGDRRHFGHLFGQTSDGVLISSLADAVELLSG